MFGCPHTFGHIVNYFVYSVSCLPPHTLPLFSELHIIKVKQNYAAHTRNNIFKICQNIFIAVHTNTHTHTHTHKHTSVNSIRARQLLSTAAKTPYGGLLNLCECVCVLSPPSY